MISVMLSGLLVTALTTALFVMLRTSPTVRRDVAEAHDLEQLLRYVTADVASTPPAAGSFSTASAQASGCAGPESGSNVLRMTAQDLTTGEWTAISYRLVTGGAEGSRLVRVECTGAALDALGAPTVVELAGELAPIAQPVELTLVAAGGQVERVGLTLHTPAGRQRTVSGTPMASTGALAAALPVVPACTDNPFRQTAGFEAFVRGDVRLAGIDSYGPVAAGGDVSFAGNYLITPRSTTNGFKATGESVVTGLLVGGAVDWAASSGTLTVNATPVHVGDFGNGTKGTGNSNETNLYKAGTAVPPKVNVAGINQPLSGTLGVQRAGLLDIEAAFAELAVAAESLESLPGTCVGATSLVTKGVNGIGAWSGSGPVWLEYQANKVNVFSTTAAQLAGMTNVNKTGASAPASATTLLVINVADAGAITLTPPIWTQNEPRSVLWNFPNATSITFNGPLWGSLLAPGAAVRLNGDMRGNVIADSLVVASGSLDWDRRYYGVLPWDAWVPA